MSEVDNNFQFRKDASFGDFLHILREDKKTSKKAVLEEDEPDIKESRLVVSFTTSGEKSFIDSVLENYKKSLFGITPFEDEVVIDGRNSDLADISKELASRQAVYPGISIGESKEKENKSDEAPQNTKTVEEPEADPEDMGLEDHDKDDFNKAGAKIKPDSEANKELAIEEVPEDKTQRLDSSKNESTDPLWLCNNCDKTFRNTVEECTFCLSNIVERITPVQEGDDDPFDSEALVTVYKKARANGRSRAEAVKAVVNKAGDMNAFDVRNMLMKKGVREVTEEEIESRQQLMEDIIIGKVGAVLEQTGNGYYYQAKRKDPEGWVFEFASSKAPKIEIKVLTPEEE